MAGLDPAIHDFLCRKDVDARHKAGHDEGVYCVARMSEATSGAVLERSRISLRSSGLRWSISHYAPIRPSVPACKRLMFSLCFQNKSSVSMTNREASAGWPNHHRNSGVTNAATNAESDE